MELVVEDQTKKLTGKQVGLIKQSVEQIGTILKLPSNCEVSVLIVDDDEIQAFNKEYRGIDRPTDVISFAAEEADLIKFEEMPRNIGDIIISYDHIELQAKNLEHSFDRELVFLLIHSMLHLTGSDHVDVDDEVAESMFKKQREILVELGYDV